MARPLWDGSLEPRGIGDELDCSITIVQIVEQL